MAARILCLVSCFVSVAQAVRACRSDDDCKQNFVNCDQGDAGQPWTTVCHTESTTGVSSCYTAYCDGQSPSRCSGKDDGDQDTLGTLSHAGEDAHGVFCSSAGGTCAGGVPMIAYKCAELRTVRRCRSTNDCKNNFLNCDNDGAGMVSCNPSGSDGAGSCYTGLTDARCSGKTNGESMGHLASSFEGSSNAWCWDGRIDRQCEELIPPPPPAPPSPPPPSPLTPPTLSPPPPYEVDTSYDMNRLATTALGAFFGAMALLLVSMMYGRFIQRPMLAKIPTAPIHLATVQASRAQSRAQS